MTTKDKKEEKEEEKLTGLALLRSPFPENQIKKLARRGCDKEIWIKAKKETCKICGVYHSTARAIHLDYVGHAALTDRLLDCDPNWDWEPLSLDDRGLPAFDKIGGLWIKLMVCRTERLGYGSADGKTGGDAVKEIIGDALRNAAMRFGAALDLWHKGDLHTDDDDNNEPNVSTQNKTSHQNKISWKGPLKKEILTQALTDLARELKKITCKDTLGFLDGLWLGQKAILEQAEIDVPIWYGKILVVKNQAAITIGQFPADGDPFEQQENQDEIPF